MEGDEAGHASLQRGNQGGLPGGEALGPGLAASGDFQRGKWG